MSTTQLPPGETEQWLLAKEAFPHLEQLAEEKKVAFLGSLALNCAVEQDMIPEAYNPATLLAAVQEAYYGDEESLRMIRTNVATDVAERMFDAGHQTEVKLRARDGYFMQHGRALIHIHGHTILYTPLNSEMMGRTTDELGNVFFGQEFHAAGGFKTHDLLLFSRTTTNEQTKKDFNFKANTDTVSAQLLSADGDDITLQTALLAGKTAPNAKRHDLDGILYVARKNGIELQVDESDDCIRYLMAVPKGQLPNGISDVAQQYDEPFNTFYGQAEPQQDYQRYAEECRRRNENFDDIVDAITEQLIREAPAFDDPFEVIKRLDELSERFCVKKAVADPTLSAAVFGMEAAAYIEEARRLNAAGDEEGAKQAIINAQNTAQSSACPIFRGDGENRNGNSGDSDKKEESKSKWMNCPNCKAKVYDDPCAKVLCCYDCKAMVAFGHTVSKGNGGHRAREKEREQRRAEAAKHKRELQKQTVQQAYN